MSRWDDLKQLADESRDHVLRHGLSEALAQQGNVSRVAKFLGVDRPNLLRLMRRLGLR